jgi:hypothetical protein
MKNARVFSLILFASCLSCPAEAAEMVTGAHPDGLAATLVNRHPAAITAGLIRIASFQGPKLRVETFHYFDSQVNPGRDRVLAPNQSRQIAVLPAEYTARYTVQVRLEGAIFADGEVTGTDYGKAVLLNRRSELLGAIHRLRTLLSTSAGSRLQLLSALDEAITREDAVDKTSKASRDTSMVKQIPFRTARNHFAASPPSCQGGCLSDARDIFLRHLDRWAASIKGTSMEGIR